MPSMCLRFASGPPISITKRSHSPLSAASLISFSFSGYSHSPIRRSSRHTVTGGPPICWNCRMPQVLAQTLTRSAAVSGFPPSVSLSKPNPSIFLENVFGNITGGSPLCSVYAFLFITVLRRAWLVAILAHASSHG